MSAAASQPKIPYNPQVLAWARERLDIAIEDVARRLNIKPSRVAAWERGEVAEFPTVRQARMLADYYDRPFLEFFSKEIPNVPEPELVPDFRFHRVEPSETEHRALIEVQRWAETFRLNTLDLLELIGEPAIPFPVELYCKVESDVDAAAERVRKFLNFSVDVQFSFNSRTRIDLPKIIRSKFEGLNVLVLKQSGIQKLRTRGICLYADTLPIIIFGSESPGATAFTLVHEFAHILLRQSAISAYPRFGNGEERKKIEGWCNRFAAAFLIPKGALSQDLGEQKRKATTFPDDKLSDLANRYGVSRHAMLIRLVNLGYVQPAYYWRVKRPQFIKEEESFEARGRATYYGSRYRNSAGDFYTGLVLEAWNSGRITNHNAAEFMGIKNLVHLNDIREHYHGA